MSGVLATVFLQFVGSDFAWAVLSARHARFAAASGLLWGLVLHGIAGLLVLLFLHAAGAPPGGVPR